MRDLKVSIVIPNWNGKKILAKNLPRVLETLKIKKNNIGEIIMVDDKSEDDSVGYLEKNFKGRIRLVRHRENRGFSAACNTGVRSARFGLICLLNTDVIPSRDFLVKVIPHFQNRKVFAVSLHEKGYGYAKGKFENGFIVHEPGDEDQKVRQSFWANGGSAVFRRSLWIKLKGFDEELLSPFYWEDIDLSYRAQKRGYKILWEPGAHVVHKHEAVINAENFDVNWLNVIKERNQLLLIWKNLTSPALSKKHLGGLVRRILRHPGYIKVVVGALKKYKTVKKLRLKEAKESTVSDEAVFAVFD